MQASAVKQWAIDHELMVHTPENAGSPQTLELLKNIEADLYLVCAYGRSYPNRFWISRKRVFQSHFSKLPKWRGASPVQAAILAGDSTTGVCLSGWC